MDGGGVHRVAAKRLRCARVDGHAAAADGLEDAQRVARCVLQARVAVHRADAQQAQARAVRGEQDGEGVLGGIVSSSVALDICLHRVLNLSVNIP